MIGELNRQIESPLTLREWVEGEPGTVGIDA